MHKLNLIITGFLGSGKTTFILRSLVERYKYKKLAIVVNDYGNISYDKVVLYREGLEVLGVEGKCICCAGMGELLETLHRIRDIDILLVETSGLSDPFTIKEALEVSGFTPHITLCLFPADIWKELLQDDIFLSQMESSDCLIISKCDLLHPAEFEEIKAFLSEKLYFTSYEGKVEENLFFFLEGSIPNQMKRSSKMKRRLDRFSQITVPIDGYYKMQAIENFLTSLPKNIIRVKGFLKVVESPLPMGINWTKNYLSWEPIDRPVEIFLAFVGYAGFSLPDFPKPMEFSDWSLMMPLGEFDKRKGIAYLYG
ncbi:MAG: CobW family GTP-binding protein, partial [Caldimicrobium sp.]